MGLEKMDVEKLIPAFSAENAKRDEGLVEPEELTKIRDIAYGEHGIENLLDIYYPTEKSGKLPVIVNIHGGGFFYGDKEVYRFYAMYLATKGFTVVNFNYRLAPKNIYPTPLKDTNEVMNWLIANQENYPMDLNNLFVVGDSAGGQLAEQYAIMSTNPEYASLFDFPLAPIKIKGLGLNCGAYFVGHNEEINAHFPFYFGEPPTKSTENQFPAENFITKDFPPSHVTTGSHDMLKDLAKPLVDILKSKNILAEYRLYEDPNGAEVPHVFHVNQKLEIGKKCNDEQTNFFKKLMLL